MCGIAAIVGPLAGGEAIEAMTASLWHRGPDDGGTWHGEGVALGHRRLSIVDLSAAGHQPMRLRSFALTYNGEIYNHARLREGLDGPFVSQTDTEVLLHLHAREGARALGRLEGMFAYAAWDERTRTLLAARDRLGIKPLYYFHDGETFALASEIKALLPLAGSQVDRTALRDFFTYKYVPTPKSIYARIRKLPAGHFLEFSDGRLRIERYWEPESSSDETDAARAQERLGALLREVVPAHVMGDVPVGVFLSGGLDSTTLVSMLDHPRTFTLGFEGSDRSEVEQARAIAAHFGTEHRERIVSGADLEEALAVMPVMYDEPFGDSAAWSTHVVSREARTDVTVALSGEGGDELFSGYGWYRKQVTYRTSGLKRLLASIAPKFTSAGLSLQRRAATGVERYASLVGPFHAAQQWILLAPELLEPGYDVEWFLRQHWREELEPVKRMQWLDLHTYLPDDILAKADRASMAVSLELRPPLLDHRLVELALSFDGALLRDERKGKLPLRRLLAGRVPEGVLSQPKRGFSMPVREWAGGRRDLVDGAFARLARAGVLRPGVRPALHAEQLWCLLVLDAWVTSAKPTL